MSDFAAYFKGKKITVMRIGLLGRGVGDAAFLAESGAVVLVVDDASQEVMQPSVDALKKYPNISFKFGPYDVTDFTEADMVLVGAGAPFDLPCLIAAKNAGVPLTMSGTLFAKLSGVPIIGITGTRGKSTVTHMIHHVLSEATEGAPVLLGGNVRGISNLQLFKDVEEGSLAVMELDSWQLQGFGWAEISPHVAVFTNFMEDHLNYYRKSMALYFRDKANIFRYQEPGSTLVTTQEVFDRAKAFAKAEGFEMGQEISLVDTSILPQDCLLAMPGEHNRLNAALAYEALKATGLEDEVIFEGLTTFPGVPGRLEYLGEKDGVKMYNDNNATTPTATRAGLKAVGNPANEGMNVVLIMGGAGKDLDPSPLLEIIPEYCKKVILLPGTGTDTIKEKIEAVEVPSLKEAVEAALGVAERGDVILFSPAFASFGLFKNEYDRGDQFVDLIKSRL